jgi:hypothetical protein
LVKKSEASEELCKVPRKPNPPRKKYSGLTCTAMYSVHAEFEYEVVFCLFKVRAEETLETTTHEVSE